MRLRNWAAELVRWTVAVVLGLFSAVLIYEIIAGLTAGSDPDPVGVTMPALVDATLFLPSWALAAVMIGWHAGRLSNVFARASLLGAAECTLKGLCGIAYRDWQIREYSAAETLLCLSCFAVARFVTVRRSP